MLGLSASNSGLVMTPMVLTMVMIGQLIARFERLKPFLLFGTGMLSLGVVMLTTGAGGCNLDNPVYLLDWRHDGHRSDWHAGDKWLHFRVDSTCATGVPSQQSLRCAT